MMIEGSMNPPDQKVLDAFEKDLRSIRKDHADRDHDARTKALDALSRHSMPEDALCHLVDLLIDGESWPMAAALISNEADELSRPSP